MRYKVEYTSKAKKDLKKLPLDAAQNIVLSISSVEDDPYSYSKKIKGTKRHPLYTHRVGEYRVILDILDNRLLIRLWKRGIEARYTGNINDLISFHKFFNEPCYPPLYSKYRGGLETVIWLGGHSLLAVVLSTKYIPQVSPKSESF